MIRAISRWIGRCRSTAPLAAAVLMLWSPTSGADSTDESLRFLANEFALSGADLGRLAAGRPVVRSLPTRDPREVATFGAVRVRVTPDYYLSQLRDIVNFKQHDAVLQIGVFGHPAAATDLRALTLPSDMVRALRDCRPRDCDAQLSADAMARLRAVARQGSVSAATEQFTALLAGMVDDYRRRGGVALMTYDDDDEPISPEAEFAHLVSDPPAILQRFPRLMRHFQHFPRDDGEAVEDLVYWSRERLGPADVVSVTHLALATGATAAPVTAAAVSRQLYASRYFDASVGLTLLLDARQDHSAATYVAYVNRSRIDALDGWFGAVKRALVRSRTRSGMEDALARMQHRLERRAAAHAP